MAVTIARTESPWGLGLPASGRLTSPGALRVLLVSGCLAAVAAAAWLAQPSPNLQADAELAFLLRGMAAIKGAIVLAALVLLLWRFGRSVTQGTAAAYLAGAWLIAGASMLVWQLALVPAAAVAFHVGEFTLLIAAWREHRAESARTAG